MRILASDRPQGLSIPSGNCQFLAASGHPHRGCALRIQDPNCGSPLGTGDPLWQLDIPARDIMKWGGSPCLTRNESRTCELVNERGYNERGCEYEVGRM